MQVVARVVSAHRLYVADVAVVVHGGPRDLTDHVPVRRVARQQLELLCNSHRTTVVMLVRGLNLFVGWCYTTSSQQYSY